MIEIDKVDQDRLYMFESEFNKSEKNRQENDESSDLQETDDQVDELEELDELEEVDELEKLPADSADDTVSGDDRDVIFISIEDIQDRIRISEADIYQKADSGEDSGESMESLVMTRTTGILPGMDSLEGNFQFEDETPELSWSADGLDYDRFLRGFKKGATGIYKSLMSLSKDYNAICGVLLAGSRKGLETDYAVGLDDESATHLSVTRNEPVWSEWFSERKVVFIPNLSGSLYSEKTSHNEFRYIRSALFMPVIFHGSQSYIFLGFKDPPADPLSMLVNAESIS